MITNNIKFFKYIRNKTAAKGSGNRLDKQCTKEIFKRIGDCKETK